MRSSYVIEFEMLLFELAVRLKASYAVEKSAVGKCEKFVIAVMIADKWSFFCPQSWLEGGCAMVLA